MKQGELDFLQALVNAQRANPNNAAIFNMAMGQAQNLFEPEKDPKEQQKRQLVDMLTKAQIGRFAETGDAGALDMLTTLYDAEDPIAALKGYKAPVEDNTASLMKEAQQTFDKSLQPYIKGALGGGDTETASMLSEFNPTALRQLQEGQKDIDEEALQLAEEDQYKKNFGEGLGGFMAGTKQFADQFNPTGNWIKSWAPRSYEASDANKAVALRNKVKSIYDSLNKK